MVEPIEDARLVISVTSARMIGLPQQGTAKMRVLFARRREAEVQFAELGDAMKAAEKNSRPSQPDPARPSRDACR